VEPQFLHPKADILYFLERKFLYNRLLCRMRYQKKRMETIPPGQLMDNLEKKSRQLESPTAPPLRKLAKMPTNQVARLRGTMEVPRHLFVLVKSDGRCWKIAGVWCNRLTPRIVIDNE
jgi:hypothetical protein